MTKEELIQLLKNYRENVAKLKLREKEKNYYRRKLKSLGKKSNIENEISISSNMGINSGIRSKNNVSDKVGNFVATNLDKIEEDKKEYKEKITEINKEIEDLNEKIEEAEIRLNSLYYKEREILSAYYVENRTAEDISQNLYFRLFNRTCSARYVRDIITKNTNKILKL